MKGLIIKDFLNILKNFKMVGAVLIFYAVLLVMTGNPEGFVGIILMLFAIYFLTTYSADENVKWDSYALTLPISRERIVQGKYVTMLLFTLSGFMFSSILMLIYNVVQNQKNLFNGIKTNAAIAAVVILFNSIMIPVINKVGILKARIYAVVFYMAVFILGSLISDKIMELYPAPPENLVRFVEVVFKNAHIAVPLILLAALIISYIISVRIYRNKEF